MSKWMEKTKKLNFLASYRIVLPFFIYEILLLNFVFL